MSLLFGKAKSTINEHIKNIFEEGELVEELVMRKFGNSEFSTKPTNFYNLDVIISVGYRMKSPQGTQFRIWATQRLKGIYHQRICLKRRPFYSIRNGFRLIFLIEHKTLRWKYGGSPA